MNFLKNRKGGNFTVPNLIAVVVLFFIFSVFSEPLFMAISKVSGTGSNANLLTKAVLYTLPAMLLLGILSAPFILKAKDKVKRKERRDRK